MNIENTSLRYSRVCEWKHLQTLFFEMPFAQRSRSTLSLNAFAQRSRSTLSLNALAFRSRSTLSLNALAQRLMPSDSRERRDCRDRSDRKDRRDSDNSDYRYYKYYKYYKYYRHYNIYLPVREAEPKRSACFQRIGDELSFRSRGIQQSASSNHS